MADTTDADLAQLLDVLCDFAADADQCLNPWPDETLAPLRALATIMRRLASERIKLGDLMLDLARAWVYEDRPSRRLTMHSAEERTRLLERLGFECGPLWRREMARTDSPTDAAERAEIEHRANIDAALRRLEDETTEERARAEEEARRARLIMDPSVSGNSPVVRGTEVSARRVVNLIVNGWAWHDILRAHPELTEEDIRACLEHAIRADDARTAPSLDIRIEDEPGADTARLILTVRAEGREAGGQPRDADCPLAAVATPNLPPPAGHADCGCADDPAREDRLRGRICPHCGTEQPPGVGWPATVVPRCLRCGADIGRAGE